MYSIISFLYRFSLTIKTTVLNCWPYYHLSRCVCPFDLFCGPPVALFVEGQMLVQNRLPLMKIVLREQNTTSVKECSSSFVKISIDLIQNAISWPHHHTDMGPISKIKSKLRTTENLFLFVRMIFDDKICWPSSVLLTIFAGRETRHIMHALKQCTRMGANQQRWLRKKRVIASKVVVGLPVGAEPRSCTLTPWSCSRTPASPTVSDILGLSDWNFF